LFDTVRIWEFFPMWTDFDKCHNLSKRNVNVILKVLSDLEPLRSSSNKKTLYSTRSCVNWAFFGMSGRFTRVLKAHECQKGPNLHTNELNTTFFCSTSPLKAQNYFKSLKLVWRFILTSCDIYQNPFTQEKILKFWLCRTKKLSYRLTF
jgi:hypothetical protein